jgi:hypothetical protein
MSADARPMGVCPSESLLSRVSGVGSVRHSMCKRSHEPRPIGRVEVCEVVITSHGRFRSYSKKPPGRESVPWSFTGSAKRAIPPALASPAHLHRGPSVWGAVRNRRAFVSSRVGPLTPRSGCVGVGIDLRSLARCVSRRDPASDRVVGRIRLADQAGKKAPPAALACGSLAGPGYRLTGSALRPTLLWCGDA